MFWLSNKKMIFMVHTLNLWPGSGEKHSSVGRVADSRPKGQRFVPFVGAALCP